MLHILGYHSPCSICWCCNCCSNCNDVGDIASAAINGFACGGGFVISGPDCAAMPMAPTPPLAPGDVAADDDADEDGDNVPIPPMPAPLPFDTDADADADASNVFASAADAFVGPPHPLAALLTAAPIPLHAPPDIVAAAAAAAATAAAADIVLVAADDDDDEAAAAAAIDSMLECICWIFFWSLSRCVSANLTTNGAEQPSIVWL